MNIQSDPILWMKSFLGSQTSQKTAWIFYGDA
jgi:hypothetical protein